MTPCPTMSVYTSLVTLTCLLLYTLQRIHASPIWRCPDFKLLPCKTLPSTCTSFRMIYIRHVHMECPACLICADPWELKPWTMFGTDSTSSVPKRHKKRKQRKQERRQERLLERQRKSAARTEERKKKEALRELQKSENRHRKRRRRRQEKLLERQRKSAARLEEKQKRREVRRLRRQQLKDEGSKTIIHN